MITRLIAVALTGIITLILIRIDEKIFDEEYELISKIKVILWCTAIAAILLLAIPPSLLNTDFTSPFTQNASGFESVTGSAIGPFVVGPTPF
jgi:hypothetical protein